MISELTDFFLKNKKFTKIIFIFFFRSLFSKTNRISTDFFFKYIKIDKVKISKFFPNFFFFIRIGRLGLNQIEFWFGLKISDWVRLIFNPIASNEIENFFRIDLDTISSDTDFGMTRIKSDWFEIKRFKSDWFGMNFNSKPLPGITLFLLQFDHLQTFFFNRTKFAIFLYEIFKKRIKQ